VETVGKQKMFAAMSFALKKQGVSKADEGRAE